MQTRDNQGYGISVNLKSQFDQTVQRVKETFQEEGFGALSVLDIKATLQEKIGETIQPYTILGMCNPKLAHQAIGLEPEIGVLLPCNVLVQQREDGVRVTAQNPSQFAQYTGNPALEPVAQEARARVDRAMMKLIQT